MVFMFPLHKLTNLSKPSGNYRYVATTGFTNHFCILLANSVSFT